ncbi:MAG: hypothetical protein Q9181_000655 [Wetmoreana brouardii]
MRQTSRGSAACSVRSRLNDTGCPTDLLTSGWRHSRQELRGDDRRPVSKDYYYIDFHATVDALKYRVLQLTTKVKEMFKPSEEKKDYYCPRCKAHWTQLEVLDSVGPMGFLCHRCGGVLEREEAAAGDAIGSEKQVKLAAQLDRIVKLLQEIDSETIPQNDFETALSLQIPVQHDKNINTIRPAVPVESTRGVPIGVKGTNQPVVQDLTVDLASNGDKTTAEKASEQDRKATIAAQNVLPVWHTQSTVKGSPSVVRDAAGGFGLDQRPADGALVTSPKSEAMPEDDKSAVLAIADESDELAAYYARMAQEREKEAREDREAEETSDEEDEEDEFEDVGINLTPSSSQSNLKIGGVGNLKLPSSGMSKVSGVVSESGSSAPGSAGSTPAVVLDESRPAAKRVKLGAANVNGGATGSAVVSDEDEDAEFEDAL